MRDGGLSRARDSGGAQVVRKENFRKLMFGRDCSRLMCARVAERAVGVAFGGGDAAMRLLGHIAASTIVLCALAAPAHAVTVTVAVASVSFSDDGTDANHMSVTTQHPLFPQSFSLTAFSFPAAGLFPLDFQGSDPTISFINYDPNMVVTYTENISLAFQLTAPVVQTVTVNGTLSGDAFFSQPFSVIWTPTITTLPDGTQFSFEVTGLVDFFSITVLAGPNELEATPLPAALPLFATGLGALGLVAWRRKRKSKLLS